MESKFQPNALFTQMELAYIRARGRKYGVMNEMAADLGISRQALHQFKRSKFPRSRVPQVLKLIARLDKAETPK